MSKEINEFEKFINKNIGKAISDGTDAIMREQKIYELTGLTTEDLIKLFANGYTLKPPENEKKKWNKENKEEKEAIVKLKHYANITAYWKQEEFTNSEIDNYIKLALNYINKLQKELDIKDKVISKMAEDRAEISEPKISKEAIIDFYYKKVE